MRPDPLDSILFSEDARTWWAPKAAYPSCDDAMRAIRDTAELWGTGDGALFPDGEVRMSPNATQGWDEDALGLAAFWRLRRVDVRGDS